MKKTPHSVTLAGYYGFGNAGDELILRSLIQQLSKEQPGRPITVLSNRPAETAAHYGVEAVNRWRPWRWLGPFMRSELFVLGGGGLLQESTGVWNHLYYLSVVVLAKLFYCRTEIRALGVDSINRWWNRALTRFIINHFVNFISVRDLDSQRALEISGVYVRLWRAPDPVCYLSLPKVETPAKTKPKIAWAVSSWPQRPGWNHDLTFLMQHVSKELGVTNELLPFFPLKDEPLSRVISEQTAFQAPVRVWQQPEDLLSWVQEYDLIIAMRYHALILAALAHKPFIGWGGQRKVRTLCRDFNQPMWTFERGWDTDAVYRQIADAWKRRSTLTMHLQDQMNRWIAAPAVASDTARIFIAQA
jgi:polysaccharide pyruvyl transferase CsaB